MSSNVHLKKPTMMSRKAVLRLLPIFVLVIGFFYYTHNFPHIFDIQLWDDSEIGWVLASNLAE